MALVVKDSIVFVFDESNILFKVMTLLTEHSNGKEGSSKWVK